MSDNFLIATESKSLLCSILGIKKIAVFNSDNIDFICLLQMQVILFVKTRQTKPPSVSLLFRIAISPILALGDEAAE